MQAAVEDAWLKQGPWADLGTGSGALALGLTEFTDPAAQAGVPLLPSKEGHLTCLWPAADWSQADLANASAAGHAGLVPCMVREMLMCSTARSREAVAQAVV